VTKVIASDLRWTKNLQVQERAANAHPIRECRPAWSVPASVADPSEYPSRRALLWALLR
jgi:hypothetical protein